MYNPSTRPLQLSLNTIPGREKKTSPDFAFHVLPISIGRRSLVFPFKMARNMESCFAVACVLLLLVLLGSSSLLLLEARPLSNVATASISCDTVKKGIHVLIKGVYVGAIKAKGGPGPGGKGHGYPTIAFKNSGPSPGEGHWSVREAVAIAPERFSYISTLLAL